MKDETKHKVLNELAVIQNNITNSIKNGLRDNVLDSVYQNVDRIKKMLKKKDEKYNKIIFDFDGVIADTKFIIYNAFKKEFDDRGIYLSEGMFLNTPKDALIKSNIPLNEAEDFIRNVKNYLLQSDNHSKVVLGMEEILYDLSNRVDLALVTSNSRENVLKILSDATLSLFKEQHFDVGFEKKSSVLQEIEGDTLYIGDELRDVRACLDSNVDIYSVVWGIDSLYLLVGLGQKKIIRTVEELRFYLRTVT